MLTGGGVHECWVHRHRDAQPLDVHHIWPLAEGGPDNPMNEIVICPNAHRRVHAYIRLLKKHDGQVPWVKRKFFGHKVRYIGQMGYDAIMDRILRKGVDDSDG